MMTKLMGWKGKLVNPVMDPCDMNALHDDMTVSFLYTLEGWYKEHISILHD
jgi:hypothetical protein